MSENPKKNQKQIGKHVYVGCGEDRREGYLHCDTRALVGIDVVCKAWEVSQHFEQVQDIYSRHMLEHLTTMEADATLLDWHDALAVGGILYLVVPNLDFHIQQWLDAEWNEETLRDLDSDARYGFAGLYGWQRQCNPRLADYDDSYWDVHKSGYNQKRLKFLLERAGYSDIQLEIKNNVHLVAKARKTMQRAERQIAPDARSIRADHRNRYVFAGEYLASKTPQRVLDLACGVGYGSNMLAAALGGQITGIDLDQEAIFYAEQHYCEENVKFVCSDARAFTPDHLFDAIVSFETIEHVPFDSELIGQFYRWLEPGGTFICSTPNQDVMPFDPEKFKFHLKHYSVREIQTLVEQAGFVVESVHTQEDPVRGDVVTGDHGAFTVLVCRKS